MDIFSLFRPSTPAPVAAPGNTSVPGNQTPGTLANDTTAPNGVVPAQNTPPAQPPAPAAPLDQFKDVWSNPTTPETTPQGLFQNLDPAKLLESARQVDFAKVIKPEQLQAISQGGEAAVKAFAESLNSVAQTVYGQSALATTKIVEQAINKNSESYDKKMQEMVKKFSVNEGLQTSNPILNNPAVQPLVGALTEQLTRKNPNATSAEIQSQVQDYFKQLGTVFAPAPAPVPNSQKARADEDWSKFFS